MKKMTIHSQKLNQKKGLSDGENNFSLPKTEPEKKPFSSHY